MKNKWENVILKQPTISISIGKNYIYFNSAMRDEVGMINGMDFFKTNKDGNIILSCKPGNQFHFAKKKNEYGIVCKKLVDYISEVYNSVSHFNLEYDNGYYILVPKI